MIDQSKKPQLYAEWRAERMHNLDKMEKLLAALHGQRDFLNEQLETIRVGIQELRDLIAEEDRRRNNMLNT